MKLPRGVESPTAVPSPDSVGIRGLNVLVVDDNGTNRRILVETLNHWGARPLSVDGGQSAIAAIRSAIALGEPFAAALFDGMMPGITGLELAEQIQMISGIGPMAILILNSAVSMEDPARSKKAGISARLSKPVGRSQLFNALGDAIAGLTKSSQETSTGVIATPFPKESLPGLRVFVVEDNMVNQKVATRMLEGMGHCVQVAGDGAAALEVYDPSLFDVILMDVSMPTMDGFEATAAIRNMEIHTGGHMTILALTAHAMNGDKERCLAAGFDGHIPKPLRREQLTHALESIQNRLVNAYSST